MPFSEQFQKDVAELVAIYHEKGVAAMRARGRELVKERDMLNWTGLALVEEVWKAICPGDTKEARLERNRLMREAN